MKVNRLCDEGHLPQRTQPGFTGRCSLARSVHGRAGSPYSEVWEDGNDSVTLIIFIITPPEP
jgi:hypothetical protein